MGGKQGWILSEGQGAWRYLRLVSREWSESVLWEYQKSSIFSLKNTSQVSQYFFCIILENQLILKTITVRQSEIYLGKRTSLIEIRLK